jgi:hypothetical protein
MEDQGSTRVCQATLGGGRTQFLLPPECDLKGLALSIGDAGRSSGVKAVGLTLFGIALVLVSYGVWLISTEDVQGGRDAAGGIFLAAAAVAALLGSLAIWAIRRRV